MPLPGLCIDPDTLNDESIDEDVGVSLHNERRSRAPFLSDSLMMVKG